MIRGFSSKNKKFILLILFLFLGIFSFVYFNTKEGIGVSCNSNQYTLNNKCYDKKDPGENTSSGGSNECKSGKSVNRNGKQMCCEIGGNTVPSGGVSMCCNNSTNNSGKCGCVNDGTFRDTNAKDAKCCDGLKEITKEGKPYCTSSNCIGNNENTPDRDPTKCCDKNYYIDSTGTMQCGPAPAGSTTYTRT
jgi:hypothetical protein